MSTPDPDSVIDWLRVPSATTGIVEHGTGTSASYAELARRVWGTREELLGHGVRPGDKVALVASTSLEFVIGLFATFALGAAASPIPPPGPFAARDDYQAHLRLLLAAIQPAIVAVDDEAQADLVTSACAVPIVLPTMKQADPPGFDRVSPGTIALNQFSSGSTRTPSAIPITHGNLAANIAAIRSRLDVGEHDVAVNWLPFYHDMGLVGMLLSATTAQIDLHLLTPERFMRNPLRWPKLISEHRGTITAAPGFALDHVVRAMSRRPPHNFHLELDSVKALILGAERIRAKTICDFADAMHRFGLRNDAIRPAYGLAEATLAVSISEAEGPHVATVDTVSLRLGAQVRDGDGLVVGCGRPLGGVVVEIRDDDGAVLGDDTLGEIVVRGASVSDAFAPNGALQTRDAGFMRDGHLYALGRVGTMLKVHGRSVFAEDVEAALHERCKLPRRAAVLADLYHEQRLVLVAEADDGDWAEQAMRTMVAQSGTDVHVLVYGARRGTIPFTSSGKPRRRLLGEMLHREPASFPVLRQWDPVA